MQALWFNVGTFVLLILSMLVVAIPLVVIAASTAISLTGPGTATLVLAFIVTMLIEMLFSAGLTYTQIESSHRHKTGYPAALVKGYHVFWRYAGLSICVAVVVLAGFIAFIVPGVFLLRRYYLSQYYLVDKDLGVFEAMRLSAERSKKFANAIWGLLGVQLLISIVNIIPGMGQLIGGVASLLYSYAPAVRYKQIEDAAKN